jgi:hypothetical protein
MNRRTFVAGGSASALALTMAGLAARRAVDAQDATPLPSTGTTTPETSEDEAQNTYQEFVAALAVNIGVPDGATVDAAVRTTLKQMVDAEFAAGNISANEATARKERIDAAESPLGVGGIGGGRDGRHGGRGGRNDGRSDRDGKSGGTDQGKEPGTDATPEAL